MHGDCCMACALYVHVHACMCVVVIVETGWCGDDQRYKRVAGMREALRPSTESGHYRH